MHADIDTDGDTAIQSPPSKKIKIEDGEWRKGCSLKNSSWINFLIQL